MPRIASRRPLRQNEYLLARSTSLGRGKRIISGVPLNDIPITLCFRGFHRKHLASIYLSCSIGLCLMDHLASTRTSTDSSFTFSRSLTVSEVLFAASTLHPLDDLRYVQPAGFRTWFFFFFIWLLWIFIFQRRTLTRASVRQWEIMKFRKIQRDIIQTVVSNWVK